MILNPNNTYKLIQEVDTMTGVLPIGTLVQYELKEDGMCKFRTKYGTSFSINCVDVYDVIEEAHAFHKIVNLFLNVKK